MNYVAHLGIYFAIHAILALGLNLVFGYCGLMTLAHAAYYTIGAYTFALLTVVAGWGFAAALLSAAALSAILSLVVSIPSWRLRGDFFVLSTLAAQSLVFNVIRNWGDHSAPVGSLRNLTNGLFGISGIRRPSLLGTEVASIAGQASLALILLGVSIGATSRMLGGPWGRALLALRDDELAARGVGRNTRLLKSQAFAGASGLAGLAGAVYASYFGVIDPNLASLDQSILMLSMVIVGGAGNVRGPIAGAALLVLFPEALRFFEISSSAAAEIRLGAYGLLLVAVVHLRPQGIAGVYRFE